MFTTSAPERDSFIVCRTISNESLTYGAADIFKPIKLRYGNAEKRETSTDGTSSDGKSSLSAVETDEGPFSPKDVLFISTFHDEAFAYAKKSDKTTTTTATTHTPGDYVPFEDDESMHHAIGDSAFGRNTSTQPPNALTGPFVPLYSPDVDQMHDAWTNGRVTGHSSWMAALDNEEWDKLWIPTRTTLPAAPFGPYTLVEETKNPKRKTEVANRKVKRETKKCSEAEKEKQGAKGKQENATRCTMGEEKEEQGAKKRNKKMASNSSTKPLLAASSPSTHNVSRPTSVVLKNYPRRNGQHQMVEELAASGFHGGIAYDFLHLPFRLAWQKNLGYAFINFTTPEWAEAFCENWGQNYVKKFSSESRSSAKKAKSIVIVPAKIQGKEENVELAVRQFFTDGWKGSKDKFLPLLWEDGRNINFRTYTQQNNLISEKAAYDSLHMV